MRIFSSKAFTLLEIMIVIAIMGILIGSIYPAYTQYIRRARDSVRVSHIDSLAKAMDSHLTDNEDYPIYLPTWCVNYTKLLNYGGSQVFDPKSDHYNGCATLGHYGYGMSTGVIAVPDVFSLLMITEGEFWGNYAGSINGFTWLLTEEAYGSGKDNSLVARGNWPYYIYLP